MDHLKRSSIAGLTGRHHRGHSRDPGADRAVSNGSQSPSLKPVGPVSNKLNLKIESPPNTFYGNPQHSSGALFSGQLLMTVVDPEVTIKTFTMRLVASITAKKPVDKSCADCAVKETDLHKWTFVKEPLHEKAGQHDFPFSYLLPGHLPATTAGVLGSIEYTLQAKAVLKTPSGEEKCIVLRHSLDVHRAIAPVAEKNSLRIFPPTNLTAHVTLAPVIHPIGDFNVAMRLSGITDKQLHVQNRWRLRKMSWRLEETEKMISPACPKHWGKVGGEGKGIQHEDVRTLGFEELKDGWKTDFSDGVVEFEFSCRPFGAPRPLCDVESPTGLSVSHSLVVELVIAEEWAPNKKPDHATPTGAARVLRMQHQVMITERSGMGISWDEEQPPMYEDVPASPPIYAQGQVPKRPMPALLAASHGNSTARTSSHARTEVADYSGPPLTPPPAFDLNDTSISRLNIGEPSHVHERRGRARLNVDDFLNEDDDEYRRAAEAERQAEAEARAEAAASGSVT